jgi:hypothetical protein
MARRVHSLHHNLQPGENVVFHREHRSKKGRAKNHARKRMQAAYVAERKERMRNRRMKKHMRDFIKGVGDLNMTA